MTLNILPMKQTEYLINDNGAIALIVRNWIRTDLHARLSEQIPWIQGQMNMFNKVIDIPRAMFFLGDEHVKVYKYSRLSFDIQSWSNAIPLYEEIRQIRDTIKVDELLQQVTGKQLHFDSCLLNFYRNGNDKIDYHSDREALGPANAVVTISLGASRLFVFKNKVKAPNGFYPTIKTILNDGDLMLMAGTCQELWTHGVPRGETKESRISLTYRLINN